MSSKFEKADFKIEEFATVEEANYTTETLVELDTIDIEGGAAEKLKKMIWAIDDCVEIATIIEEVVVSRLFRLLCT